MPTTTQGDPFQFLGSTDAHYAAHEQAWLREEKRLYGGDLVLDELTEFTGEEASSFDLRQRTARYLNFPDLHTSILSGHLRRAMPMPEFGSMGEVRTRAKVTQPTLAELFWYNCDGVGQDGSQFPAWLDGVLKRACATGYRWIMVEMPTAAQLEALRAPATTEEPRPLTQQDVLAGFRPWLVERSPLSAPRHRITNGVLEYVVFTVPLPPESDVEVSEGEEDDTGYYVLVRRGCTRLGDFFKAGGWWLVAADHTVIDTGTWDSTDGEIPVVRAVAEYSQGTYAFPALARSLTMELGQIAIDVMNARSEQRYNARQAAKSINWLLGCSPKAQAEAATQVGTGSILVAVPPVQNSDGTFAIPQMWNSSAAALDTGVYTALINEAVAEAREIMIRQVTSEPGSSGESKMAGFEESNAPMLARLAVSTETWINSILYFFARRAGLTTANASLTMPRDFNLRQVLDDVDAMLDSMRRAAISSPTWERGLLVRKGDQLGLIPDEERDTIIRELTDAAQKKQDRADQQASLYGEMGGLFGTPNGNRVESGNGAPTGRREAAASGAGAGSEEE